MHTETDTETNDQLFYYWVSTQRSHTDTHTYKHTNRKAIKLFLLTDWLTATRQAALIILHFHLYMFWFLITRYNCPYIIRMNAIDLYINSIEIILFHTELIWSNFQTIGPSFLFFPSDDVGLHFLSTRKDYKKNVPMCIR